MKVSVSPTVKVSMKYKTRIMDAKTGECVKDNPWNNNLVMDLALNSLANSNGFGTSVDVAKIFEFAKTGSGTNPVRIPGNTVLFSQTGTTLTSDSGFFTSAMVGAIFKRGASGTAGAEVYITAFTNSTTVTVGTSQTFTNENGVVWMVQMTTLQTPNKTTNTYQTAAGDNSTTFTGSNNEIMTLKRTFVIPVQVSSYTVNEIGWSPVGGSNGSGLIAGRAVLSSSDVVGTTNFYVLVIILTYTYSPNTPTAVSDVGTNINTAGNAMIEFWATHRVATNGTTTSTQQATGDVFDANSSVEARAAIADYTQSTTILATGTLTYPSNILIQTGVTWVNFGSAVGVMRATTAGTPTTAAQSLKGFLLGCGNGFGVVVGFDVKLTTPVTLPTGTWSVTVVWQVTFGRTLDNT